MVRALLALACLVAWHTPASAELLPGFEAIGRDNEEQGLPTNQHGDEYCVLAASISQFWQCRTEALLNWVSDLVYSQRNASQEYSQAIRDCNNNPIIKERSACISKAAKILQDHGRNTQFEVRDLVESSIDDIQTFYNPKKKKAAQAAIRASLLPPPATDGGNAPVPGNWPGTKPDPNAGPNK